MKTEELVAMLAKGESAVEPNMARRRFTTALGWGSVATVFAMASTLGVRPDLADVLSNPMFWMKLMFPALVAVVTVYAAARLGRPGVRLGRLPGTLGTLIGAVWALGILVLLNAASADRSALLFGDTWIFCLIAIPLLAIPVFVAAIWALQGLAPTRLSLAGGAAGLLAGAVSAAAYALHCPELGAPFIAVWYVIGMFIPALAGALLGPRVLRW
jgi:hypothetical protein